MYEAMINGRFAPYGLSSAIIKLLVKPRKRRGIFEDKARIKIWGYVCILFLLGGIPEVISFFIHEVLPLFT